jgi:hypothetical protein
MAETHKIMILVASGIGAFALLLLIISVATPAWLEDGTGNTIGLFRKCYAANATVIASNLTSDCFNEARVTQGGLSVFGLLLLIFAIIAGIVGAVRGPEILFYASLGLMYFSSMFVMSAYATWGTYSREPLAYHYPRFYGSFSISAELAHTSMGYSYHLCVAAHFFLWTALTLLAYGIGVASNAPKP